MDVRLNLALVFTVSVLPDVDVLFFSFVIFLPFFAKYRRKTIPYFVAFLSHFLIGDIYYEGIQLFWPFSSDWICLSNFSNRSGVSVVLELALFVMSIIVMLSNKDFQKLLFDTKNRIYWLVPLGAVLGPIFIGTIKPDYILPRILVIPSLFYILIFSSSIIGLKNKN